MLGCRRRQIWIPSLGLAALTACGGLHVGLQWLGIGAHYARRRFTKIHVQACGGERWVKRKGEWSPLVVESSGAHVGNRQSDM